MRRMSEHAGAGVPLELYSSGVLQVCVDAPVQHDEHKPPRSPVCPAVWGAQCIVPQCSCVGDCMYRRDALL